MQLDRSYRKTLLVNVVNISLSHFLVVSSLCISFFFDAGSFFGFTHKHRHSTYWQFCNRFTVTSLGNITFDNFRRKYSSPIIILRKFEIYLDELRYTLTSISQLSMASTRLPRWSRWYLSTCFASFRNCSIMTLASSRVSSGSFSSVRSAHMS